MKRIIARPRPDSLPALVPMPIDLSFPSAHTAQITAFCLCLALIAYQEQHSAPFWAASFMGLLMVGAVGYSRVYLQVHYISDVVAGVVIPMVWVMGVKFLLARLSH